MTITRRYLSVMVRLSELWLQFFGLWPYYYDCRRAQFIRSMVLSIYGGFVNAVALALLATSMYRFQQAVTVETGGAFNAYSYQVLAYLQMLAVLMTFGTQQGYGGRLAAIAGTWIRCMADARHRHADVVATLGYRCALALFTLKAIGINLIQLMAIVYQVYGQGGGLLDTPMAVVGWMVPSMLLTTVPDVVFGLLLVQHHLLRLLNARLRGVVATLQRRVVGRTTSTAVAEGGYIRRPFERMQTCCELSEQLDELALLHERITESVLGLNACVAWTLLMWSLNNMLRLVMRLYIQFLEVARMVDENDVLEFRPVEFGLKLLSLTATFAGMVLLADVCSRLVTEAELTGKILHQVHLSPQMDVRFKRSVRMKPTDYRRRVFRLIVRIG